VVPINARIFGVRLVPLIYLLPPLDKIEQPERMLVFQRIEKMQQWRCHVLK
jgi:hypothetical protein